jgi:hypothetical protein
LLRPRERDFFEDRKIVTSYRSERNRFALCDEKLYGPTGVYFIVKKPEASEALEYLLGLLDSQLLDFWMELKSRKKGKVREYTSSTLNTIPIRRINFDNPDEVKLHDAIVEEVETIRKKMKELSQYSQYFTDSRLTRLGFDEPLPALDQRAVIDALPDKQIYSIRTHPSIKIIKPTTFEDSGFRLQKVSGVADTLEGPELKLVAKDKAELILSGPRDLLELLARLLRGWKGKGWDEIRENLLLPESAKTFAKRQEKLLSAVDTLRDEIASVQTKIDEVVYRLYEIDETSRETIRKGSGRYSR